MLKVCWLLVSREEAEALAKKLKVRLYRTSVKEDFNVSTVFEYLSKRYIDSLRELDEEESQSQQIAGIILFLVISL